MIAQARLGPGRIHHCMRAIGMAERAFEIMCRHANTRVAFGGPLGEKQFVQEWVATSRMEIDQARLLTLHAAWKMDTYGKKAARQEISMIKVVVPNMLMKVLDRAIQCLGSLGMSDDTPIAAMWRNGRSLRIADGPGRGAQDGDRAARAEALRVTGLGSRVGCRALRSKAAAAANADPPPGPAPRRSWSFGAGSGRAGTWRRP